MLFIEQLHLKQFVAETVHLIFQVTILQKGKPRQEHKAGV